MKLPIIGKNLILREFNRASDVAAMEEIAATPGFSFYAFPAPESPRAELRAAAEKFVDKCIRLQEVEPLTGMRENYKLAIAETAAPEKLVGYIALDEISEARGEFCDIGYIVSPAKQGKGIAAEASRLMLKEFFNEVSKDKPSYNKIWATVHPGNIASAKTLEKLGFKIVGEKQKEVQGKIEPRLVLELTRDAFFAKLSDVNLQAANDNAAAPKVEIKKESKPCSIKL